MKATALAEEGLADEAGDVGVVERAAHHSGVEALGADEHAAGAVVFRRPGDGERQGLTETIRRGDERRCARAELTVQRRAVDIARRDLSGG